MELQKSEIDQIISMCDIWLKRPNLELEATFFQPEELWSDAWESASSSRQLPSYPGIPYTNFVAVERRLQQVGLIHNPLQDTLNILTVGNYRWTITGMNDIQRYCETESLADISFTCMTKTLAEDVPPLQNVDYGLRIKARMETPIDIETDATAKGQHDNWANLDKSYRLIRRYTFVHPEKLPGVRIDVSAVSEEVKYPTKEGIKKTRILRHGPKKYEVEVELDRETASENPTTLANMIIRASTLVIQGIQGNFTLVKSSEAKRVRLWYSSLIGFKQSRWRPRPSFIGPNPVTLSRMNMTATSQPLYPNIVNESYNVTDKADGNRCFLVVDNIGGVFLMDTNMHVYATGYRLNISPVATDDAPAVLEGGARRGTLRAPPRASNVLLNTVMDCEFVTRTSEGKLIWHALLFDAYYIGGVDIRSLPFREESAVADATKIALDRFSKMKLWFQQYEISREAIRVSTNNIVVRVKDFYFPEGDITVLKQASALLKREHSGEFQYHTDGLIFTPNHLAVGASKVGETVRETGRRWANQFKWKPPEENTIDFLVRSRRDATGREMIRPNRNKDGSLTYYKIFDLYTAGTQFDAVSDPYTVFMQTPIAGGKDTEDARRELNQFAEVLFQPLEPKDPLASVVYMSVEPRVLDYVEEGAVPYDGIIWTKSDNPEQVISDTVVEMRYNPLAEEGWKWEALRIRHDKTERYHLSKKTKRQEGSVMNAVDVAQNVWKTLHYPVSVKDIITAYPLDEETVQAYFNADTTDEMRGATASLRKFHNQFIKDAILLQTVALRSADGKHGAAVWDIGSGTGQDIHKYIKNGYEFALMTDATEDNIKNPYRGAAWLALQKMREKDYERKTDIIFAWADAANSLENGEAGMSTTDKDILKALFAPAKREAFREFPETIADFIRVKELAGAASRGFDVVSCMFTLHYFFESEDALNGLLRNMDRHLRVGGHVIMCNFDGEAVYALLYGLKKGQSFVRRDARGNEMWHITKLYDNVGERLPADAAAFGLKIAVSFYRVMDTFVEYLVPNRLLDKKMGDIGCEPAKGFKGPYAELLSKGTGSFEDAYHVAVHQNRTLFEMSPEMLEYSKLNRWYIYRRMKKQSTKDIDSAPHHDIKLVESAAESVKKSPVISPAVIVKASSPTRRHTVSEPAAVPTALPAEPRRRKVNLVPENVSEPVAALPAEPRRRKVNLVPEDVIEAEKEAPRKRKTKKSEEVVV